MSPYGNYIIINHNNDRLTVLNANDGTLVWAETEYGLPSHFDVQVDQNGDEVVVGVAKSAPHNGLVIKRKLSDGTTTALTKSGYASHTSGRNLKRPGWVFVTYQNLQTNDKYLPYIGELVAVRLDGTRVERICNLRVDKRKLPSDDQYYFEAHGCPSPDGLRAVFASDWNAASYPVQAYVVDFRDSVLISVGTDEQVDLQVSGLSELHNYPNPFHSETYIRFSVQTEGLAEIKILDLVGKEVAIIFNEFAASGRNYSVRFDATSLPAGIYFARLKCGNQHSTNKMILLK